MVNETLSGFCEAIVGVRTVPNTRLKPEPLRGRTRAETAAFLVEYRSYIRSHPDCELTPVLERCVDDTRAMLVRKRQLWRSSGLA